MIDKKKSIKYWNGVAEDWKHMVYNTDGQAWIFPSSQLRQKIVVEEIKNKIKKDAKILDIGCADGRLVIELIKNGYTNVKGIDNSPKMIEEAKKQLDKAGCKEDVFYVEDADDCFVEDDFDVVIAMGLIEYLEDVDDFFQSVYSILNEKGIAYIESKNKLFNLFSANDYTKDIDVEEMIKELDEIKHLSPKTLKEVAVGTFIEIGQGLNNIQLRKNKKQYEKYPYELPQYSPKELMYFTEGNLFKTQNIIYYHCHPFPSRFEKDFPELFFELGIAMQPLGYTPVGALICSAFVMEIRK